VAVTVDVGQLSQEAKQEERRAEKGARYVAKEKLTMEVPPAAIIEATIDAQGSVVVPEIIDQLKELKSVGARAKSFQPLTKITQFERGYLLGLQVARAMDALKRTRCQHTRRVVFEPESSTGDESDYASKCIDCGAILRMEPTR
jgi:hypothetical protein